jgi:hypothetical protein
VTFGQWTAANARIIAELVESGQLVSCRPDGSLDVSRLQSYLRLNAHVGELLDAGYDWKVVLSYDEDMRVAQHDRQCDWDTPDLRLVTKHMTAPKNLRQAEAKAKPQQRLTSSGQPLCGSFNSANGCKRQACKYAHVCRICEGRHPASQHKTDETKN